MPIYGRPDWDARGVEHVPADEPVFVIRGQDAIAIATVLHYAALADQHGCPHVAESARQHAYRMGAWARTSGKGKLKIPDIGVAPPLRASSSYVDEAPVASFLRVLGVRAITTRGPAGTQATVEVLDLEALEALLDELIAFRLEAVRRTGVEVLARLDEAPEKGDPLAEAVAEGEAVRREHFATGGGPLPTADEVYGILSKPDTLSATDDDEEPDCPF